jgi:LacI family transcriptional regulator
MDIIPALRGRNAALVGFGDFQMADQLTPSVSVVSQDPVELGRLAANRALARFADRTGGHEPTTVLPVSLVRRESCGCSAVD